MIHSKKYKKYKKYSKNLSKKATKKTSRKFSKKIRKNTRRQKNKKQTRKKRGGGTWRRPGETRTQYIRSFFKRKEDPQKRYFFGSKDKKGVYKRWRNSPRMRKFFFRKHDAKEAANLKRLEMVGQESTVDPAATAPAKEAEAVDWGRQWDLRGREATASEVAALEAAQQRESDVLESTDNPVMMYYLREEAAAKAAEEAAIRSWVEQSAQRRLTAGRVVAKWEAAAKAAAAKAAEEAEEAAAAKAVEEEKARLPVARWMYAAARVAEETAARPKNITTGTQRRVADMIGGNTKKRRSKSRNKRGGQKSKRSRKQKRN